MQKTTLLLGLLLISPAFAQNPQPAAPTNPTPPIAPPNAASPPPEKLAPGANGGGSGATGSGSGNLSDRLSQQRGTIKPPAVDPGMSVAPPQSGTATTPVIPPPGSPGGNQSVVPK